MRVYELTHMSRLKARAGRMLKMALVSGFKHRRGAYLAAAKSDFELQFVDYNDMKGIDSALLLYEYDIVLMAHTLQSTYTPSPAPLYSPKHLSSHSSRTVLFF
jgi:hypothetical protein